MLQQSLSLSKTLRAQLDKKRLGVSPGQVFRISLFSFFFFLFSAALDEQKKKEREREVEDLEMK